MNHPSIELGTLDLRDGVRAVLVAMDEAAAGSVLVSGTRITVNCHEFSGRLGQTAVLEHRNGLRTIAVGLGAHPGDLCALREATAAAVRASSAFARLELLGLDRQREGIPRESAVAVAAEAVELGSYRYLKHKSSPVHTELRTVGLAEFDASSGPSLELGAARGRATNFARDLTNEPAEDLSPEAFAEVARRSAQEHGLDIEVYSEVELEEMQCGGLLAVGKGSSRPPRLIRLTYAPADSSGHLALVGKGITFDSGGLNTKSVAGMELMRADMAGAATILAAMQLLGSQRPSFAVSAWLAVADNMSGPAAMRPGDVIRARNGVSIEILNTDAEGRLVLADALSLAAETRPDAIVDVATLTDTVSDALGPDVVGVMGNHRGLVRQLFDAGKVSGENVWPLPLSVSVAPLIESDVADLRNIQKGAHGIVAAGGLFLERFVDGLPWAHLDVGMAAMHPGDHALTAPGATGWGVRMLSAFVQRFAPPDPADVAPWDPF